MQAARKPHGSPPRPILPPPPLTLNIPDTFQHAKSGKSLRSRLGRCLGMSRSGVIGLGCRV